RDRPGDLQDHLSRSGQISLGQGLRGNELPKYTVKQGDHLSKIANEHGFTDYRAIWDHPSNADLKKKRENPNILQAGDVVHIPEKELKTETGSTEQRHRFKAKIPTVMLRVVFKDFDDKPIADKECELNLDGRVFTLKTDGQGKIEQRIPAFAETGLLTFKDPEVPFDPLPVRIGHLDPADEVSGWQARLNNLGYPAGPVDGKMNDQLKGAIEEFQCDAFKNAGQVDGKCGPNTIAKLKKVYGC
ncbi:MAG TPA: peptidoglycan-binding protein, partial [Thermodesulfobacteriota bacterium]|nr:peptidoglycan-binding protein [Thermodesulfobacteriota bacterium]